MILQRASDFFEFMKKREQVRLRKEAGLSFPWVDDDILSSYKFTNVYRHYDRTSAELRRMFYNDHAHETGAEILMNCALFRYFGTYEFAEVIGWQKYEEFDFEGIKEAARQRLALRQRVFTGAYVITNQGISAPKQEVVVDYFLRPLWQAAPRLMNIAMNTLSWKKVATEMRLIPGFGGSGFMTKETLLDTTYTSLWGHRDEEGMSFPEDWSRWTPVGPGARRGISRLLGNDEPKNEKEITSFNAIMKLFEDQELLGWPGEWKSLSPHDVQFQLCEFDKYERVRLGQGRPRSVYRHV